MGDFLEYGSTEVSITMLVCVEGVKNATEELCSSIKSLRDRAEETLCSFTDCEEEEILQELFSGLKDALRHVNDEVVRTALRVFQKLCDRHAYTLLAFVDLGSASRYGVLEALSDGDERTVAAMALHLA